MARKKPTEEPASAPAKPGKPSALLDTRLIYCGDNLEQLKKGEFEFTDTWHPIQVKQKDKTGRPDIDSFEAVMMREERMHGFFVSFDFTKDAYAEIGAFFKRTGRTIRALTVKDILYEAKLGMKLS